MKNRTEQINLLFTRVAEAMSSKEFRKQLVHHTDLDIAKIEHIGGAVWITLKDGSYFKLMTYISRSPYKVDPETGAKVSLDPEDPRNGGKKDLSETTRWRVSFEVDLKGLIPQESDLQPHDYPLLTWAHQALFDCLLNHSLCAALATKTDYLESTPDHKAMRDYMDEKVDLAQQAIATVKMERISCVPDPKKYSEDMRKKLLDLGFSPVLADECIDLLLTGMWERNAPDDLLNKIFQSLRLSMEEAANPK